MRVILFGATGMVGSGVLRECLLDPAVTTVLCVGRSPSPETSPKLRNLVRSDLYDLSGVENELTGYDACFFCLGVSSAGMREDAYRKITYDLTVSVGTTLARRNPSMTFVYVSGTGTDSTEHGRRMWARVKGATENALLAMPFKGAYMFRPGVIRGMHGIRSKSRTYRVAYAILLPFVVLVSAVAPNAITTTEAIGRAMIHVAERGAPVHLLGTREINRLAR